MALPNLPYPKSIMRSSPQTAFGGLNHNAAAGDGELFDMTNLSSREFPLLTNRPKRGLVQTIASPEGLGAEDKPFWASGTKFYFNGTEKGTVTESRKTFAVLGTRVLIFPDKKYYDWAAEEFGSLEAATGALSSVAFRNGYYEGVPADANTIYKSGDGWATYGFKSGDAVTISGCTTHPENNKTAIIREIDGNYLKFYEYTFTLDSRWRYAAPESGLAAGTYHFTAGGETKQFTLSAALSYGDTLDWDGSTLTATVSGSTSAVSTTTGDSGTELTFSEYGVNYTEAGSVTLKREVPELTHVCVNENRLWGCKDNVIYASKPGDPFNFNVFDGLTTDSWQSGTVDAGPFTACVSYLGYPVFFKEDMVYKVYGDKPSNFTWTPSARLGVKSGCAGSLAVAGETLFYLSPAGICAYTGGIPSVISDPLGANTVWTGAAAGSDGLKYYVSLTEGTAWSLYVYDTRYRTWHREDALHATDFAFWDGGLYMLGADGKLWRVDGTKGTAEASVSWVAEFADFTRFYETTDTGSENKKGLLRLLIRCELDTGASMTVSLKYDSAGSWQDAKTISATAKKSFIVPLILRRNDHFRLKLSGSGGFKVWSVAIVRYSGSHLQS